MTVLLSLLGGAGAQFFDNNGVPLLGGKIYTYAAGTTTPQATYTSSSGGTAHSNPIVLDSAGRVPGGEIWLTDALNYKFSIFTSANVLIGTYDNISGANGPTTASRVTFTGYKGQVGTVSDLATATGSDWIGFTPSPTGTLARSAQDKMRDVVSVADFGIVGGTNETTKLENLRQYAIANPGTYFDFRDMPNKELQYYTPKWMAEIEEATFNFTGISLRNLGAGTYGYADMDTALVVGSGPYFFNNQGTGQLNPANVNSGDLIADATAGAQSITLITPADAANYSVGDQILLRWYERQGAVSFPPNPGFFEWLTVSGIAGSVIQFTTPLRYSYQAQAPDYTSGASYLVTNGRARILNVTRAQYTQCKRIKIIGGTGVNTGSGTAAYRGALFITGADYVEVENAQFTAFFNNCSRINVLRNCVFSGLTTELDKIVGQTICDNVVFNNISQGTGVQYFYMTGGEINGTANLRVQNIYLDNVDVCTTTANTMLTMDQYPRQLVSVKNCRFIPVGSASSAVQVGNIAPFTPDAITQSLITVNATNVDYTNVIRNIAVGATINRNAASGSPENFYVTGFSFDASDNLLIAGYCEVAAPAAGSRSLWTSQELQHHNNIVVNPPDRFDFLMPGRRVWHVDSGDAGRVIITRNLRYGELSSISVNCYVTQIAVNVVKPYTGTDAICTLTTGAAGVGAPQSYILANGQTIGRRVINVSGQYGAQAGDTLTALPNQGWCEDMQYDLRGDAGAGAFTDAAPSALPLIRVTIEGYKPPLNLQQM